MNISEKSIVLRLNSAWQRVGYGTVANAIVDLVSGESIKALDIQYVRGKDGRPDMTEVPKMIPVGWEEWITLPVRDWIPWEEAIHSAKLTIRVPTIVIATNFHKMPVKEWKGKPSNDAIYLRDGSRCQYTGRLLSKKEATKDHVIPKSRGGTDDWTNLVLTSKEINNMKGNSLNSEVGLNLLKNPIRPRPTPVSQLIREAKHKDWELFID